MFGTAVATVTLIEDDELQFMARQGDWGCSTGRAGSFCDFILVEESPAMLIVEDASQDARWVLRRVPAACMQRRWHTRRELGWQAEQAEQDLPLGGRWVVGCV